MKLSDYLEHQDEYGEKLVDSCYYVIYSTILYQGKWLTTEEDYIKADLQDEDEYTYYGIQFAIYEDDTVADVSVIVYDNTEEAA